MSVIGKLWYGLVLVEALSLFLLVSEIGFFHTLLLYAASGLLGAALLQRQGQEALKIFFSGRIEAGADIIRSLCLILAGLLLIFPGPASDLLALMLFVPSVRKKLQDMKIFNGVAASANRPQNQHADPGVIEGEYVVVEEDPEKIEPPKPPR